MDLPVGGIGLVPAGSPRAGWYSQKAGVEGGNKYGVAQCHGCWP